LLVHTAPWFRDHLITLVGTGMRPGELLGLRADRVDLAVDLAGRRLEVVEVRYEAGRFGRGYKDRPKSATSIRVIPLAGPVAEAIARQLPDGSPPRTLVFAGPGGGNFVPAGSRTALSRDNLRRAYRAAVTRASHPAARLGYTPGRVLRALRKAGPEQSPEAIRGGLRGRLPTTRTVHAALCELEAAGLAARRPSAGDDGWEGLRWSATTPPRDDSLANLRLRGPHNLRHTFSTWLEDAGIPARVIDELMGHAGGRHGGGELERRGSLIGSRYRWTTPEMQAPVVAAVEQRLAISLSIAPGSLGHRVGRGEDACHGGERGQPA
jgi:integrase